MRPRRQVETLAALEKSGFVLLADVAPTELVLGIEGRFWALDGGRCTPTPEVFRATAPQPGTARAVWGFSFAPLDASRTLLTTQTRVLCADAAARRRFLPYWFVIKPASGLIRRAIYASCEKRRNGVPAEEARLTVGAELVEAEAWSQLQLALPESFRTRMGIAAHRHGRAVALITGGSAEIAVNRVIGLGVLSPISPHLIETIIRQYSSAGVERFLVQVNPQAITPEVDGWLLARGFVARPGLAKLSRTAVAVVEVPLEMVVRVVEIDVADVGTFEAIVAAPLMVPEEMRPGIRSTIGHARWRYYLALRDERPIAGAALYAGEEVGWCGLAATVESERGRGAQTALLARRIQDAAASGCQWVVAETPLEKPDRPNPSIRNMRRLGFEVHHQRRNYLFGVSDTSQSPA